MPNPGGISTAPITWLDASLLTAGANIYSWSDLSSTADNMVATYNPPYCAGSYLNGLGCADFYGGQCLYGTVQLSSIGDLFLVMNYAGDLPNDTNGPSLCSFDPSFESVTNFNVPTCVYPAFWGASDGDIMEQISMVNGTATPSGFDLTTVGAGAFLEVEAYLSYSNMYLNLGQRNGAWWNGYLAELILFAVNLSSSDRTAVRNYLGQKWLGWTPPASNPGTPPAIRTGGNLSNTGIYTGGRLCHSRFPRFRSRAPGRLILPSRTAATRIRSMRGCSRSVSAIGSTAS
jgi:hypothetical protein